MPNGQILYPGTAQAGDVKSGKTFSGSTGANQSGTMPVIASNTKYTPTAAGVLIPAGYHDGTTGTTPDPNLTAVNILSGVSIFGVAGSAQSRQYASGTVTSGTTLVSQNNFNNLYTAVVSGLTFTPNIILLVYNTNAANWDYTLYQNVTPFGTSGTTPTQCISNKQTGDLLSMASPDYVNSTGFELPVGFGGVPYKWYAWL